jgi:acyl-CoA synthetase (AMP-forming)/AMP-acid ligase II
MQGYADDADKTAEAMRDGYYHTGDVGRATPTATSPMSAAPTTCSRPRATGSARSSSRAR